MRSTGDFCSLSSMASSKLQVKHDLTLECLKAYMPIMKLHSFYDRTLTSIPTYSCAWRLHGMGILLKTRSLNVMSYDLKKCHLF